MAENQIGLIGGLAMNAGMFYYHELARRHADADVPLKLLLAHASVHVVLRFVSRDDRDSLARYLAELVVQLQAGGCAAVAITAVAPHLCVDELRERSEIPIIDLLAIVRDVVDHALPYRRVAIFGNKAVIETNIFGSVDASKVVAMPQATIDRIHELYSGIALLGKRGSDEEFCELDAIAVQLRSEGAEAILLAGTDLSAFYSGRPPSYPFVDLAQLHIDAITKLTGLAR